MDLPLLLWLSPLHPLLSRQTNFASSFSTLVILLSLVLLQASWLPAPTSARASKDSVLTFSRRKEGSQTGADELNNVVADCPARRIFIFFASDLTLPRILPVHLRVTSVTMSDKMVLFYSRLALFTSGRCCTSDVGPSHQYVILGSITWSRHPIPNGIDREHKHLSMGS